MDLESETSDRTKQYDVLSRTNVHLKQVIDKEVLDRAGSYTQLESSVREVQQLLEKLKHDRALAEDTIRNGFLQEESSHSAQVAGLQDAITTLRHDLEEEMRLLKQMTDNKVRERRQVEDDMSRRLLECLSAVESQKSIRESFEVSVRSQFADAWHEHLHEKHEITNWVRRSMHSLENQIAQQLGDLKTFIDSDVGFRRHAIESLEKRVQDLFDHDEIEARDRAQGDDEVMRVATQARQVMEKEVRDRRLFEEQVRQQTLDLNAAFDQHRQFMHEQHENQVKLADKTLFEIMKKLDDVSVTQREFSVQHEQCRSLRTDDMITELQDHNDRHVDRHEQLAQACQALEDRLRQEVQVQVERHDEHSTRLGEFSMEFAEKLKEVMQSNEERHDSLRGLCDDEKGQRHEVVSELARTIHLLESHFSQYLEDLRHQHSSTATNMLERFGQQNDHNVNSKHQHARLQEDHEQTQALLLKKIDEDKAGHVAQINEIADQMKAVSDALAREVSERQTNVRQASEALNNRQKAALEESKTTQMGILDKEREGGKRGQWRQEKDGIWRRVGKKCRQQ